MRIKTKIKILSISNILTSASVKETTTRRVLTVIEVPEINPYGKAYHGIEFEIEVHNSNIEQFGLNANSVSSFANVELICYPFKKSANEPVQFKFLVNKLEFEI